MTDRFKEILSKRLWAFFTKIGKAIPKIYTEYKRTDVYQFSITMKKIQEEINSKEE